MFTFLTRLGRLAIAIPVAIVVITIIGYSVLTTVPVANKHRDPVCTITPSAVGAYQTFTISAAALPTTDPVYLIATPPSGNGSVTPVYPNSDGSWSGSESASQPGTWTYTFSGMLGHNKYGAVESCSVQV